MVENCIFCNEEKLKDQIICQTDFFYAIFDIHPVNPGHMLIIPKRHIISVREFSDEEWINLKPFIKVVVDEIEKLDFKDVYEKMKNNIFSEKSPWFCNEIIQKLEENDKIEGYNVGWNFGKAAGNRVEHWHLEVIPRFFGDSVNPDGGIKKAVDNIILDYR